MIVPWIIASLAAATLGNRERIARKTQREYAARFRTDLEGIAEGAEGFTLNGSNGCGVLMLHGSGDSPRTLRYLGEHLNAAGYTIHAPLLPGHGRSPRAFAEATPEEYLDAARAALARLRKDSDRIALVGLSMGGAIAAQLAAEEPSTRALALLAPYLVPPPLVRRLARSSAIWGIFAPYLKSRGEASVRDVSASLDSRAYGTFSPGAIKALVRSASMAMDAIPALTVPAMVVNSKEDNRIPRECADEGIRAFRAAPEVHWVSGCGHVITIDYCKEEVAKLVLRFLDKHTR